MSLDVSKKIEFEKEFNGIHTGQKILIDNLEAYFVGKERRDESINLCPIITYKEEGKIMEMQINMMGVGKVFDYKKEIIENNNPRFGFYQTILEGTK
jgi:hypothetical protein